ncbi:MAG TPA: TraR/DksA C4-type zinc finger protein [Pseudomonadota bacterium]|nr:TraR/DksA C4-type zinc finger protein [Pseudomonadota bacterium]
MVAPLAPHLSESQLHELRRQLLNKGAEVSALLADILAGKAVDPRALGGFGGTSRPGERATERLRRFLDLIGQKLQATRNGTYGFCAGCGEPLALAALTEVPWADQCRTCAQAA